MGSTVACRPQGHEKELTGPTGRSSQAPGEPSCCGWGAAVPLDSASRQPEARGHLGLFSLAVTAGCLVVTYEKRKQTC